LLSIIDWADEDNEDEEEEVEAGSEPAPKQEQPAEKAPSTNEDITSHLYESEGYI